MHLDEQEILAFVDGERDDLREHVDVCELCRRAVAAQEEARDALRASGLIDPPPLAPVIATLPSRLPRTLTGWPRTAAILAPVAAGAIALAIVTTRGEDSRTGPQPEAATALKTAPAPQDSARAAAPANPLVVRAVSGPVSEIERRLRTAGIRYTVVNGTTIVAEAPRARVLRALRGLPDGPIVVQLVPRR